MGLWHADMNESARTNRSRDRQGAPSGAARAGTATVVCGFRGQPPGISDRSTLPGPEGTPSRLRLGLYFYVADPVFRRRAIAASIERGASRANRIIQRLRAPAMTSALPAIMAR